MTTTNTPELWRFSPGTRVMCPYTKMLGTISDFPNGHGRVLLRWDETPKSPNTVHIMHLELCVKEEK